jgi:hypothetical protein
MALTAEQARKLAVERAGLSDFGPSGWEEGLERTLDAFGRLPLNAETRQAVEAKIIGDLAMRLRIEDWREAHPAIADQPVEAPVLVCGLPRTGTTATVAMLALDERLRFLRAWEGSQPVPPPVLDEEAQDPRRIAAHAAAKDYAMRSMHLHDPDGPEEDLAILSGLTMHGYHGHLPMPEDYLRWWIDKDFTPHYAYLERVLKLLHSRRPPHRWLLKSPPHLFKLEAFSRRFPDARFVMTHRDPAKVIASTASLQCSMQVERCAPGAIDPKVRGRMFLDFWREGMDRGLAARAALGEERFIDVRNADVVERPIETFERIYDHLGMSLGPDLRAKLETYSQRNAPGAFGEHRYTPEDYGLTAQGIRATFKDYIDRFCL